MVQTWKRPKLKIPKTKSEWVWDIVGYTVYIGSIILLFWVWGDLPDKVPAHYNGAGEVDRWGSKGEIFLLPGIGLILLIFLQVLEKFPEVHNYPVRLNESNVEKFYLYSRKLLNQLKNICLIIFSFILFESVSVAMGWGFGLGKWILPLLIIGTLFPIVWGLMKQMKIK